MKKVSDILIALGVVLFIYVLIGRFIGAQSVFGYLYMGPFEATSSLVFSNSLILIGLALKSWLK